MPESQSRPDPVPSGSGPSGPGPDIPPSTVGTEEDRRAVKRARTPAVRRRRGPSAAAGPPGEGGRQLSVSLPRFRGRVIPPLDRGIIMALPPLLIGAAVVAVIVDADGTARIIERLRTLVTSGFTWWFVLYSLLAVAVCTWLCASRIGGVRLGGPQARPEHGNFAWYSMLFACGQGIGLIFWSLAEPILLREGTPVVPDGDNPGQGGIVWTYFHWGFTAWAMYCVVAVCLAYSHHNLGKTLTFREATVDLLPAALQRPAGVLVELLAIIATVLGLATSFAFAAMQFSSGASAVLTVASGPVTWTVVIVALGALTAVSAFMGVNKGMKRVSEVNSVLSIVLVVGVFLAGPTVFILSNTIQTFGSFFQHLIPMSFWTGAPSAAAPLETWEDSWNGWWTVFIWCWVIAFSPFVAGFIARISRGRTIREFVLGVTIVPSIIVMVWVGVIGSAGIHYDDATGQISADAAEDTSSALFSMLQMLPWVGTAMIVVATILVATYYVTSLDSGTYALAEFVSAPKKSGPMFRVVLVVSIATVAIVLLSIGGVDAVDTVQTGTIIGGFPFSFVIVLMIVNLIRRLRSRDREVRKLEKVVNDPVHRTEDDFVDDDGIPRLDPRRGVGPGTVADPTPLDP